MKLLDNVTTTGAGASIKTRSDHPQLNSFTFQGVGTTSSGTGSASINIEVSNNGSNWLTLGTITLSLSTTAATDGFASTAAWGFTRANVTAISGTGATVSVTMGT